MERIVELPSHKEITEALSLHKSLPYLSGAWHCQCGCIAPRWEGMAAHLASVVERVACSTQDHHFVAQKLELS
jgi:hypothetical protein